MHKNNKILLLACMINACTPVFVHSATTTATEKRSRLEIIDAALAKAEVDFFEEKSTPNLDDEITFSDKYARENVSQTAPRKHRLEIDAELFYYRYKEPDVMRNSGTMRGFYGNYIYRPSPEDLLYTKIMNLYKVDGRFSLGEVDYKADNHAELKNIDDWAAELRGIFGKEYLNGPLTYMIYSGFGYRYLNDNSGGRRSRVGNTVFYGYKRESNYYYLPLGLEFTNKLNTAWSFSILGEYDWLIYGLQKSHLSDGNQFLSTQNDDIENAQHHGYGVRASLRIVRESVITNFILEPFIRYWNIDDSDITTAFVDGSTGNFLEPQNNTLETGIKIGVQF